MWKFLFDTQQVATIPIRARHRGLVFPLVCAVFVPMALGAADKVGHVGPHWVRKAPLPLRLAEVGVAALDGQVVVIGGTEQTDGEPPQWKSTRTLAYDPKADAWVAKAPLPTALSHVGVAVLSGKIYAIGGFGGIIHMQPSNRAFVYDIGLDRWSKLPSMPMALGSVAVAAVGGKLHVFGGRRSNHIMIVSRPGMPPMQAGFGTVNTHMVFDPVARRWSEGSPIPGPSRDHAGIAVLNGKVHLFGGRLADVGDNLDRHDVYDDKTGRWSTAARLPRPRSAGAYAVWHRRIIYAGGECKPGGTPFTPNAFDDVSSYDARSDRWSPLPSLPQARHAFGAATIRGVVYFAGGAPVCGGGMTADLLALETR